MKSVPWYLINKDKKSHSHYLNVNCKKNPTENDNFSYKTAFFAQKCLKCHFQWGFSIINIYI